MSDSLLPSNASKLDRAIEKVIEHCTQFPVDVRDLWAPWRCPLELLPWLAWAYSVDTWNESWSEDTKRRVVDRSFEIHRYRATPYSIRQSLDTLDINTTVVEWWEQNGSGEPGTLLVNTFVSEQGIDMPLISAIDAQISKTKRGSQHFTLRTVLSSTSEQYVSCATCSASIATVEPYTVREINSEGSIKIGMGTISAAITTVEVYQ